MQYRHTLLIAGTLTLQMSITENYVRLLASAAACYWRSCCAPAQHPPLRRSCVWSISRDQDDDRVEAATAFTADGTRPLCSSGERPGCLSKHQRRRRFSAGCGRRSPRQPSQLKHERSQLKHRRRKLTDGLRHQQYGN